jgi:PAP2 superfamily
MRARLLVAAVCAAAVALPAPAGADTVTDWNQNATTVLIGDNGQGAVANAHLAMVEGAVYDAVNAIDRRYTPLISMPRAKRWYSQDAAAATAAYRVLVGAEPPVVPSAALPAAVQKLRPLYEASLAAIPDGPAKQGGIAVGVKAADAMIEDRLNDGRFTAFRFAVGTGPGQWRPTPPGFVNDPGAWLKDVRPFLLRSSTQFRTRGPNALTSRRYATELAEVRSIGSLTSAIRTPDQTQAAQYWGLANGPATWSAILRSLASSDGRSLADHARMLAMVYTTSADAAIVVWVEKAKWSFWRPITAIQNDATDPDPTWTPLITNPPYPDHPSGLSSLGGAAAATLADFYGTDDVAFAVPNSVGITRSYASFSQAADEIVDARVWSGIHFRTADEQGAKIGRQVARFREGRFFLPRHGHKRR